MENISSISLLIRKVLSSRGLKSEKEIEEFLHAKISSFSEPFTIPYMRESCEVLKKIILNREKVFIYGDGDTDGICGVFLLLKFLEVVSADFSLRLTHRLDQDYEIEEELITDLRDENYSILISVDCGISSFAALKEAENKGIRCIVLDHHIGSLPQLPKSHIYVDPYLTDEWPEGTKNLSGAGIAFKFIEGMSLILPGINEKYFHNFIETVCLSVLADSLPLTGENRLFVREGLRKIPFTVIKGLAYLIEKQNLHPPITSRDITMKINPKLNSPGRLGKPEIALELLMEEDEDRIRELVDEIEKSDRVRYRTVTKEMENLQHHRQDTNFIISESISPGICGIIASRLSGKYNKPYLVGAEIEGSLKGSIRAPKGYNLYEKLKPLGEYMLSMGGHQSAMGFKCSTKHIEKIRRFWDEIDWDVQEFKEHYDCELDIEELTPELIKELNEALEPYGKENPAPVFLCRNVVVKNITRTKNEERKFWITGKNNRMFEAFLSDDSVDIPLNEARIDILYTPCIRAGKGLYNMYLKILRYSPST